MIKKKIVYVVLIIVLIILNLLYINYQFYYLLLLLLIVPFFSFLYFVLSKIGLKLYINLDSATNRISEVQTLTVKINKWKKLKIPYMEVMVIIQYSNCSYQQVKKIPIHSSQIEENDLKIEIEARYCGVVQVTLKSLIMYDFFRLFSSVHYYNTGCEYTVLPNLLYSDTDQRTSVNHEMYDDNAVNYDEDCEMKELRAYQAGDALSRIHWNMSSKLQQLIVKQYSNVVEQKEVIVADLSIIKKEDDRDNLDKIYQMVYSLSNYFLENKRKVVIVTWNEEYQRLDEYELENQNELINAIINLVHVLCCDDSDLKSESAIRLQELYEEDEVFFVTAREYTNELSQSICVKKDSFQEIAAMLHKY